MKYIKKYHNVLDELLITSFQYLVIISPERPNEARVNNKGNKAPCLLWEKLAMKYNKLAVRKIS